MAVKKQSDKREQRSEPILVGLFTSDLNSEAGRWRVHGQTEVFDFGGHRYKRDVIDLDAPSGESSSFDLFAIDTNWPNELTTKFGMIDAMELCATLDNTVPFVVLHGDAQPKSHRWFYEEARSRFPDNFKGSARDLMGVPKLFKAYGDMVDDAWPPGFRDREPGGNCLYQRLLKNKDVRRTISSAALNIDVGRYVELAEEFGVRIRPQSLYNSASKTRPVVEQYDRTIVDLPTWGFSGAIEWVWNDGAQAYVQSFIRRHAETHYDGDLAWMPDYLASQPDIDQP